MKSRLDDVPHGHPSPVAVLVSLPVELCPRCQRETLPRRAVNSLRLDMHRAPTRGMVIVEKPDPRADRHRRLKERKERKRSLRSITKEIGIAGAITILLQGRDARIATIDASDDCPECSWRQRKELMRRGVA